MRDHDGVPRHWPAKMPPKQLLFVLALLVCVALTAGPIAYAVFADRRNARRAAEMAASKAERALPTTAGKDSRPQLVAMLNGTVKPGASVSYSNLAVLTMATLKGVLDDNGDAED